MEQGKPFCTAKSPCELDSVPMLTMPAGDPYLWQVWCSQCHTPWWTYRSPRWYVRHGELFTKGSR